MLSPSQIKLLCAQYGLTPSKQYGQHYLITDAPVKKMIAAAGLTKKETVVEIGPGFGILTFALAEHAKQVIAFEIEKKLLPYWEEKQKEYPNVHIVWGNVLKEMERAVLPASYTLVANLPYQITSHVIRLFLEAKTPPKRMIIMVQKEVAERITAKKGDMNLLGLSVQVYGTPRIVTTVPKGAFWPPPKVNSAVVAIDDIHKQENADAFFCIARVGFGRKRKQLWRNLSLGLKLPKETVQNAIITVAQNPRVRAEDLSAEEWMELVRMIGEEGGE